MGVHGKKEQPLKDGDVGVFPSGGRWLISPEVISAKLHSPCKIIGPLENTEIRHIEIRTNPNL